ncbi:MAG: thioredoxin family protein [Ferruginibacter sp.]|nr:thioredoxin family protein [Ferruginibacter sp.]
MKKFILFFAISTAALAATAQTPYTSSKDPNHADVTILKGIISKYILQNDPSFKWYAANQVAYQADTATINALGKTKDNIQYVVFGGTWCEDTQFILPKFFKLQETAGVPDKNVSFFAVDRSKQTLGNVASAFKITNVPTIIVMKDGKEIGRVVEYGKTGKWDKELADLLHSF